MDLTFGEEGVAVVVTWREDIDDEAKADVLWSSPHSMPYP
jgi:hypothetical protein